jgi:tRNA dimethylallyltransferase
MTRLGARTISEHRQLPVIAILGPTAVGKSRIGIGLARRMGGEIICADSRQLYRHLDLGTDKVPLSEQAGIPHHLQDSVEPVTAVSAGLFTRMADRVLEGIRRRGALALLVGGSGLYVEAFLGGLFDGPESDERLRKRLRRSKRHQGDHWLHRILKRVDPASAGRLAPLDHQRIVRALEVYFLTGRPLSSHLEEQKAHIRVAHIRLGLEMDRQRLNQRIEIRVDQMFEEGLVDEVRSLLDGGLDPRAPAMSAIGYREIVQALEGSLDGGLEHARELVKRNTRRYAKRQMTWLRHHGEITWFERQTDEQTVKRIEQYLDRLLQ